MLPIPAHIASIERPVKGLLTFYFFKALATTVAFPVTMAVLYFRYHTMRYRFDEEGVHMSWGIIMRREIMLNYARIQDIQLRSNVLERWLGLARIEIQTASGSASSTMTLEGLENHEAMRDFLYSRMRGAHERQTAGGAETGAQGGEGDSLAETLNAIAVELKAVRELLEKRSHA
ncbi:MAG: PH domain-containing protein [Acidobacteriota bacterium]